MLERAGRLPHSVVACVGGGSNAMGIFAGFLDDAEVRLIGVEAAGEGLRAGTTAPRSARARPGVLHGSLSYLLQDADGQVRRPTRSRPGSTIPASGPSTATCGTRAG